MKASDFFYPEYRVAFTAACELHLGGHPVSVETIAAHLNRTEGDNKNLLASIGGAATLASCLNGATPEEAEFWSKATIKARKQRELAAALEQFQAKVIDTSDPDKLRHELEENLVSLAGSESTDVAHVSAGSNALAARVEKYITDAGSVTGFATGWRKFDTVTDGFRAGAVTIVYAKSSRYKSLFVQNIGHLLASQGIPGLWFTTEMPQLDVQERLLQLETGLNLRRLRQSGTLHEHAAELDAGINVVDQLPIYMSEGFDITTSSLRSEIKRQKRWNGIEYVILDLVDHVQTNKYKNDKITQQEYVMRQLKDIAKKESVHIIAVSHVAKGDRVDPRQIELPVEDMKGSSSKYQDVDMAMCIVPFKYGVPPEERREPVDRDYALTRDEIQNAVTYDGGVDVMITITKNRQGDTGRFRFYLDSIQGGRFLLVD